MAAAVALARLNELRVCVEYLLKKCETATNDELSRDVGVEKLKWLKQEALDVVNLCDLGTDRVWEQIANLSWHHVARAYFDMQDRIRESTRAFLISLSGRLRHAEDLVVETVPVPVSPASVRSKNLRERRVDLVVDLVNEMQALMDEGIDSNTYEDARKKHKEFRIFRAVERYLRRYPGCANPALGMYEVKSLRPIAEELAATWFKITQGQIHKDCNKYYSDLKTSR